MSRQLLKVLEIAILYHSLTCRDVGKLRKRSTLMLWATQTSNVDMSSHFPLFRIPILLQLLRRGLAAGFFPSLRTWIFTTCSLSSPSVRSLLKARISIHTFVKDLPVIKPKTARRLLRCFEREPKVHQGTTENLRCHLLLV